VADERELRRWRGRIRADRAMDIAPAPSTLVLVICEPNQLSMAPAARARAATR
jgi:hypothetical protein